VITLDADLQHPPERIPDMLDAWRRGFDVVHMRRRETHSLVRRTLAAAFYALFNAVSDVDIAPRSTDFRLLDRACIQHLSYEWRSRRFLRAAARCIEFRQTELAFDAPARYAGSSSYTVWKLLGLAADAVRGAATRSRVPSAPRIIS
jgi:dolichol-phosphate mannosyltransferase